MTKKSTYTGGRKARLIDESGDGWYHVYNRIACDKEAMPLAENEGAQAALMRFIQFYTKAYCCQVASYVVMGNHYHLIVKMDEERKLSKKELQNRVEQLYPNTHQQSEHWLPEHWEHFEQRLFKLSELMRNIQQGYARWFNRSFGRRGRFWADRFKSTILYGEGTLLECMEYIDLNPIRAGIVERPEDYPYGAYTMRQNQNFAGLSLAELINEENEETALNHYRNLLYLRGSIATKEGQTEISDEVLMSTPQLGLELGRPSDGETQDHLRFFVDGLVVGCTLTVENWLKRLRESGRYLRRCRAHELKTATAGFASLREQRRQQTGNRAANLPDWLLGSG